MSWTKSSLAFATCHCLLVLTVQAEEQTHTPLYQCPAYLQLGTQPYAFQDSSVYSGPIEERAILVPEPHPDENPTPSFGIYETSPSHSLYVKCRYKDIEHYLVLEAKGARWCAFTQWTPTWCE